MDMIKALEQAEGDWAAQTLACLRQRSPLMLHRQPRTDPPRPPTDHGRRPAHGTQHSPPLLPHKHLDRSGTSSETVEGIRALAVDKDNSPAWNPARIEDITSEMIEPFFTSPWPADQHPLKDLD